MASPQVSPSRFDLRAWIQNARALGQVQDVEGADLKHELGAIAEINSRRGGPAFLFDKFAGYPAGFRVMTGAAINPTTLALTLSITACRTRWPLSTAFRSFSTGRTTPPISTLWNL